MAAGAEPVQPLSVDSSGPVLVDGTVVRPDLAVRYDRSRTAHSSAPYRLVRRVLDDAPVVEPRRRQLVHRVPRHAPGFVAWLGTAWCPAAVGRADVSARVSVRIIVQPHERLDGHVEIDLLAGLPAASLTSPFVRLDETTRQYPSTLVGIVISFEKEDLRSRVSLSEHDGVRRERAHCGHGDATALDTSNPPAARPFSGGLVPPGMEPTILIGVALGLLVFGTIEFADDIVQRLYPVDEEFGPE